ncbi:MAG: glycosyltransferase family 39 protein [Candidatus Aminicenantes bacterium]|nr:glycosyltransferase family 39 protein [Candidatus Aminicenantes bacterium]
MTDRLRNSAVIQKALKILTWFFYLFFVFLWFKGNIPALRGIKIGPSAAFFPLAGLLLIRFFLRFSKKPILPRFKVDRKWIGLAAVLLLAVCFRVPFLAHSFGLVSSDVAVPCLMGKHIAEGGQPPVYYYGQLYLGSLASHFYALVFFLFGYSVWLFKLSNLLFFLGFITVQFLFLKDIFDKKFALVVSFFCSLPIGYLMNISLDDSGVYSSLVLFLGSLAVYTAFRAVRREKTNHLAFLGFVMGLSFWSHQISIFFILTACVILVVRFGFHFRFYFRTAAFFLIGAFPLIIHEVAEGFPLLKFLSPGKGGLSLTAKLENTAGLLTSLMGWKSGPAFFVLSVLLLFGLILSFVLSWKEKRISAKSLYGFFFMVFLFVYLLSGFSNIPVHRYVFPAVFCLPVLLISPILLIRFRWREAAAAALISCLFIVFSVGPWMSDMRQVASSHDFMKKVIAAMKETGTRVWQGDYWTAYLISALSGEDIFVDSYTINRYYPYRLFYHNSEGNENYVFLRGEGHIERERARNLHDLLNTLGIEYKKKSVGDCRLIYGIQSPVSRSALTADVPETVPEVKQESFSQAGGFLETRFTLTNVPQEPGFRLHVEIPGFCSRIRGFSPERKHIRIRIPYPFLRSFSINFYLDYKGLIIPSSRRSVTHDLSGGPEPRRQHIVYLDGTGPEVEYDQDVGRICLKNVRIEINGSVQAVPRLRLKMISPFAFSHPYWYGKYCQKMRVELNGIFVDEIVLKDGSNLFLLDLKEKMVRPKKNILVLEFTYHLPLESAPLWKTAALLQEVNLE